MQMQDVEKTEIQRDTSTRRMRRRKRMRPLYGLIVAVLVAGVGVSLSATVFFNISTIEIAGNAPQYTAEDIAQASGVHTGDNMMRLDGKAVAQNVTEHLVFVEKAVVKKKFPDTLLITVTPAKSAYNVVDESSTLQVSASGKILRNSPDTDASLPVITGFHPAVREAGEMLTSQDPQKDQIFQTLTKRMAKGLTYPLTEINMEDKYEIVLTFDNRIVFQLGNWSDLEYKITLAQTVMGQLSEDKNGYLYMIGDNQCSYRDRESVEMQTMAPLVTLATDENGNTVLPEETDEDGMPLSTTTETTAMG